MMKLKMIIITLLISGSLFGQIPTGQEILDRIDENMYSNSTISTTQMVIHGRRGSRTITAKSWSEGDKRSFSEYLSPAREKGTKMLKLEDKLWMFSPSTDRIIQISGHMLKQSVMGSDLSYEDMMEESKLTDHYDARVIGTETYDNRSCWILELTANTPDVAYHGRKQWIDRERFIPLKEELFAKGGKLLKKTELKDITQIEGRWYPKRIIFKDMLKTGKGTEFIIDTIQFDVSIPAYIFSKASLR